MEKPIINYESLIRITKAISMLRDPEEIVLVTVESVTYALKVKGCTVFLFSMKSDELKLAGSFGLSMALELCRVNKGLKHSIDILKTMRDPKTVKSSKRTPYEGVPKSFSDKEMFRASV